MNVPSVGKMWLSKGTEMTLLFDWKNSVKRSCGRKWVVGLPESWQWVKLYLQKSVCSTQTVMFSDSYIPFLIGWPWLSICLAFHKVESLFEIPSLISTPDSPNITLLWIFPASTCCLPPKTLLVSSAWRWCSEISIYHCQGSGCPNKRQG